MITKLLRITCLTLTATYNAVLIPPQNKYITNEQPDYEVANELWYNNQFETYTDSLLHEGTLWDDPYTTTTYSTMICTTQNIGLRAKTLFLTAYQIEQQHDNNDAWLVDRPNRKPFVITITQLQIIDNTNIVWDINHYETYIYGAVDNSLDDEMNIWYTGYVVYDKDLTAYINTLWDFFGKNRASIVAEDPFIYKNNLINEIKNVATQDQYNETAYITENAEYNNSVLYQEELTITNNQTMYIVLCMDFERADKTIDTMVPDPTKPLLDWYMARSDYPNLHFTQKGWIVPPINYEVIDVPDLMFTIVGMPFTFISRAFNLTLFPNTPYAVNIGNIFLSLIGVLTFIFVLKVILKLKG